MNEKIVEFVSSTLPFLLGFQYIYTLFTSNKQTKDKKELNTMLVFLLPSYKPN